MALVRGLSIAHCNLTHDRSTVSHFYAWRGKMGGVCPMKCSGVCPMKCSGVCPMKCSGVCPMKCSGVCPMKCSGVCPMKCSGVCPMKCSSCHPSSQRTMCPLGHILLSPATGLWSGLRSEAEGKSCSVRRSVVHTI